MAKPDRKISKAAKAEQARLASQDVMEPSTTAVEQPSGGSSAAEDIKSAVHKEIYQMLKRGELMPGYTIVPASKADRNQTVEVVLLHVGEDALVKLKPNLENKYHVSTVHHKRGVIKGSEAKELEQLGFDRPRN